MQSTTICKLQVKIDLLSDTRKFKQNYATTGEGQVFKGTLVALGEIEFYGSRNYLKNQQFNLII